MASDLIGNYAIDRTFDSGGRDNSVALQEGGASSCDICTYNLELSVEEERVARGLTELIQEFGREPELGFILPPSSIVGNGRNKGTSTPYLAVGGFEVVSNDSISRAREELGNRGFRINDSNILIFDDASVAYRNGRVLALPTDIYSSLESINCNPYNQ